MQKSQLCREVLEKSQLAEKWMRRALQRSVVQPLPPIRLLLSVRRIGSMPARERERERERESVVETCCREVSGEEGWDRRVAEK